MFERMSIFAYAFVLCFAVGILLSLFTVGVLEMIREFL